MADRWREQRVAQAALVGATLTAFLVRLAALDQSLDGDELFTYANTVDRSFAHVIQADQENNPPLFYVLAWLSAKLGDPTVTIRLPSLVLGTALVPIVYGLGARTVGRMAGLAGAALVALGPFYAFYGIEARGYATLTFAAALSTLCLLAALDTGRRRWWAGYVLASLAVMYTHYLGIFVLAAQAVWALWVHRDHVRALALTNGLVALGCLPLAPAVLGERGSLLPDTPLTASSLIREFARLQFGHPQVPWDEVPGRFAAFAFLAAVGLAVVVVAARGFGGRAASARAGPPPRLTLLVLLGLATPLGFVLYSFTGPSIALGRYLLPSLPALSLVLGALLVSGPRPLALACTGAVLAVLVVGTIAALDPARHRPDYKAAAEFVDRAAQDGDAIVDSEIGGLTGAQAFLRGGLAPASKSYLAINLDRREKLPRMSSLSAAVAATAAGQRVFLVARKDRLVRPVDLPLRPIETRSFPGVRVVSVAVYERTNQASSLPASGTIVALKRCLQRRSLDPVPAEAPERAVALKVTLGGGATGLILLYGSASEAEAAVEGVGQLLSRSGEAERRNAAVIGYFDRPADTDRRRIAGCL